MRVLLLTPIHTNYQLLSKKKIKGIPFYQTQSSWVRAIESLGHEVEVFIYTKGFLPLDSSVVGYIHEKFPIFYGRVRRKFERYYFLNPENWIRSIVLKKIVKKFDPDVILISGGISSILPFALGNHKNNKNYLLSGINPLVSATALEKTLLKKNYIDLVVENDQGYAKNWKKIGAKKVVVLPISSADSLLHTIKLTASEKRRYKCDVAFVGSITEERLARLEHFRIFDFKFWGDVKPGVKISSNLKKLYMGEAYGEKMLKVIKSAKIIINFQPKDMTRGGNMRTFEIPAIGTFQLTDKVDNSWFKNDRPEQFHSSDEVVEKVKYFLKHKKEREYKAKKLQKYVLKYHTYEKHFKKLLQEI